MWEQRNLSYIRVSYIRVTLYIFCTQVLRSYFRLVKPDISRKKNYQPIRTLPTHFQHFKSDQLKSFIKPDFQNFPRTKSHLPSDVRSVHLITPRNILTFSHNAKFIIY